jgi:hypothetical protein
MDEFHSVCWRSMPYSASQARRSWRRVRTRLPLVNLASSVTSAIAAGAGGRIARPGAELGVSQDQAVQWRIEHVDAEWRDAQPGLAQHVGRECGEQVVFGRGQVGVSDQSLDEAGPVVGGHLLGELELAGSAPGVVDPPQSQARAREVAVGDPAAGGDG